MMYLKSLVFPSLPLTLTLDYLSWKGIIDTPGYVAVATNGALKGLDMRDADAAGQQLVFCNSYHLVSGYINWLAG